MRDHHASVGQDGGCGLATGQRTGARHHRFVTNAVAAAHNLPEHVFRAATRCRAEIALARQIAIYLGHVSCGLSLTAVGAALGRDRTTAAHACQCVEERRDDPLFDLSLDYLDAALRARGLYDGAGMRLDGTRRRERRC
jgi:hypothetical protein